MKHHFWRVLALFLTLLLAIQSFAFAEDLDVVISDGIEPPVEEAGCFELGDPQPGEGETEAPTQQTSEGGTDAPAQQPAKGGTEETADEVITEKPVEALSSFEQSATYDNIVVTVRAEPGVFPANAQLSVTRALPYEQQQAEATIVELRGENADVLASYSLDIKVIDPETGRELQPADGQTVRISFSMAEMAAEGMTTNIYHIAEDADGVTAEALDIIAEDKITATVVTSGFSVYCVQFSPTDYKYVYIVDHDDIIYADDVLHGLGLEGVVTDVTYTGPDRIDIYHDAGVNQWVIRPVEIVHGVSTGMIFTVNNGIRSQQVWVLLKGWRWSGEEETITYLDYNPKTHEHETRAQEKCIFLSQGNYIWGGGNWYALNESVTFADRIEVKGDAYLILCNGATLNAPLGISVTDGNSLTIYAQSRIDREMGRLDAGGSRLTSSHSAAIGGDGQGHSNCGTITINGGTISAIGGMMSTGGGAGIGGAQYGGAGNITINGGRLDNIYGGPNSAGIGSGALGAGGSVTINGGYVNASGDTNCVGIGSAFNPSNCGTVRVTINGGNVEARGGSTAAGIGSSGTDAPDSSYGGTITINGGKVYAEGGSHAAGIGGGSCCNGGEVIINGGEVEAYHGEFGAAGIGSGEWDGSHHISAGYVEINGGKVFASGGELAAAIGGGNGADGGDVYIYGGQVDCLSTFNGVGIGGGKDAPGNNGQTYFGWKKKTDYIYASSYSSDVNIMDDMWFTDGTEDYNCLSGNLKSRVGDKMLTPVNIFIANNIENGTVAVDKRCADAGETVTVNATPNGGYHILSGSYDDGKVHLVTPVNGGYTFTKTGGNVTVSAEFGKCSPVHLERIAPTYSEGAYNNGRIECWQCPDCGSYFSDADGENPISEAEAILPYFAIAESGDKASVTGYNGEDAEVVIPDVVPDNYPDENLRGRTINAVSSSAFAGNDVIRNVVMGDYIETVGWHAFYSCSNLEEIEIGSNLKQIDSFSFSECPSLVKFTCTTVKGIMYDNITPYVFGSEWLEELVLYGMHSTAEGSFHKLNENYPMKLNGMKKRYTYIGMDEHTVAEDYPVWTWAEDYGAATAAFKCAECDYELLMDAEITVEGAYIVATASFEGVKYTDAVLNSSIHYIDANGELQTCDDYTVLDASTGSQLSGGWYVVADDLELDDRIVINGDVHLILGDNATLTANGGISVCGDETDATLSIYAQSMDRETMGCLSAGSDDAGNAAIGGNAYDKVGAITINGGVVIASGGRYSADIGCGMEGSEGVITINSGEVTANGSDSVYGIGGPDCEVILGWRHKGDSVTARSYAGSISVASGKFLYSDGKFYTSALDDEQCAAIAGKTLVPANVIILDDIVDGKVEVDRIFAEKDETVTVTATPDEGYSTSLIVYNDGSDHTITPEGGVGTFAMPEGTVFVSALFEVAVHVEAILPTYDAATDTYANGNIEYWYCPTAERYFTDADCLNEISEAETILPYFTLAENGDQVCVTGYNGGDAEIVIPDVVPDNYPDENLCGWMINEVSSSAFASNDVIEKVVMGDYLETIGWHAFNNCANLKEVEIGTHLNRLDSFSFTECPSLVKFTCKTVSGLDPSRVTWYVFDAQWREELILCGMHYGGYGSFRFINDKYPIKLNDERKRYTYIGIDAHTPEEGYPIWTWAEDCSAATAVFKCAECAYEETAEALISIKGFTCTATATFDGVEYTDTRMANTGVVTYLDANGQRQTCDDFTVLDANTGSQLSGGWYVVADDLELDDRIVINGDVHLILMEGVTLTANGGISVCGDETDATLSIYAQSTDRETMGCLSAGSDYVGNAAIGGNAYDKVGAITINGGVVIASGGGYSADIGCGMEGSEGVITINGGEVTANGSDSDYGIGGPDCEVILGCRNRDDSITARSYAGSISVASGKYLYSDGKFYTSALNDEQCAAIAGKTLVPANVIILDGIANGKVEVDRIFAEKDETVKVTTTPDEGYSTSLIVYNDGSDHTIAPKDGVGTFAMPEGTVFVSALFEVAVHVEAILPTYDAATDTYTNGNIEYWYYPTAERYFTDADCLNEIIRADTIIPYFTFIQSDGSIILRMYNGTDAAITIPDKVPDSYPNEALRGQNITQVDQSAFKNNTIVEKVVMGDNIALIGWQAFNGCTNLKEVEIGAGLKRLNAFPFSDCPSLEKITCTTTEDFIQRYKYVVSNVPSKLTIYGMHTGSFYDLAHDDNFFEEGRKLHPYIGLDRHDDPAWTWTPNYMSATAVFDCERCYFAETLTTSDIASTIVTPPTADADGSLTHTASVTVNGYTYTDTVTEVIPAGSHAVVIVPSQNGTVKANKYRAVEGDTVTLTAIPDPGYALAGLTWTVDGGEAVAIVDGAFTMPEDDVAVTATFVRGWPGADFTLPKALAQVEEEAFTGIAATFVLVPEDCESIGARAFKDCTNLEMIRIENADCTIGDDAFAGCGEVYIFAPQGSPAQAYAESHDNCEFVSIG